MRAEFVCVSCGCKASALYKEHSSEILRLQRCKKCDEVVDKYVEFDSTLILIDLILLKQQAYRHVLFNAGPKPFWKLAVILLICDAYTLWTSPKNGPLGGGSHPGPLLGLLEKGYQGLDVGPGPFLQKTDRKQLGEQQRSCRGFLQEDPLASGLSSDPRLSKKFDSGVQRFCSKTAEDPEKPQHSRDEGFQNHHHRSSRRDGQKIQLEWDFYIMAAVVFFETTTFLVLIVVLTQMYTKTPGVWCWTSTRVLVHGMVVASSGKLLAIPALVWGQSDSNIYLALASLFIWLSQVHVYQAVRGVSRMSAVLVVTCCQFSQFTVRWILLQIVGVV